MSFNLFETSVNPISRKSTISLLLCDYQRRLGFNLVNLS